MKQAFCLAITGLLAQIAVVRGDGEACGDNRPRDMTGIWGVFQSPNHPNNYPNNANCQWRFTSLDFTQVRVYFDAFSTERRNDEVTIYDGPSTSSPVLLRASGSTRPPIVDSTSDTVLATFTTDSSAVTTGFRAKFLAEKACGLYGPRVLSDSTGSISSPFFPDEYAPELRCNWTIQAPVGQKIRLSFDLLDLEESETLDCRWDYVDVYDGKSQVGRYCGSVLPPPLVSSADEVKVFFRSDINQQRSGFRITYETIGLQ